MKYAPCSVALAFANDEHDTQRLCVCAAGAELRELEDSLDQAMRNGGGVVR